MDKKTEHISDEKKDGRIPSEINLTESVDMATLNTVNTKHVNIVANENLPKSEIFNSTFSSVENDRKNSNTIVEKLHVSSDSLLKADVSSKCDTNVIKNDTINNNMDSSKLATPSLNQNVPIAINLQQQPTIQESKISSNTENPAIEHDIQIMKQMRSTSVQVVPNSNIQSVPNSNMQRSNIQPLNSMPLQPTRTLASQQVTRNPSQIPIIGYEVMEERARFTIYKLRVDDPRTALSWLVFRRYTDFVRLHSKLKSRKNILFPLPEKRLFKDNFDPAFLDNRARGLQAFVNAVMKTLPDDACVREFFCLDEPPPAVGDSEPEAQALFGALEDTVGALRDQIRQKEEALEYLRRKVFYLEERSRSCSTCNPTVGSPDSSGSSNCS